jgi:hypothetical protein
MKSATKRKETLGSETPISQKKLPPKVLCEEIESYFMSGKLMT